MRRKVREGIKKERNKQTKTQKEIERKGELVNLASKRKAAYIDIKETCRNERKKRLREKNMKIGEKGKIEGE